MERGILGGISQTCGKKDRFFEVGTIATKLYYCTTILSRIFTQGPVVNLEWYYPIVLACRATLDRQNRGVTNDVESVD